MHYDQLHQAVGTMWSVLLYHSITVLRTRPYRSALHDNFATSQVRSFYTYSRKLCWVLTEQWEIGGTVEAYGPQLGQKGETFARTGSGSVAVHSSSSCSLQQLAHMVLLLQISARGALTADGSPCRVRSTFQTVSVSGLHVMMFTLQQSCWRVLNANQTNYGEV